MYIYVYKRHTHIKYEPLCNLPLERKKKQKKNGKISAKKVRFSFSSSRVNRSPGVIVARRARHVRSRTRDTRNVGISPAYRVSRRIPNRGVVAAAAAAPSTC